MDDKKFFDGLNNLKNDSGKMASLRRVLNPDNSRQRGLGIIASIGVTNLNDPCSLPYKIVAYLFSATKSTATGENFHNLGHTLKQAFDRKTEISFDRRFDCMVASTSVRMLAQHLIKLPGYLGGNQINFTSLLLDLNNWGKNVADRWIEGYYN